jgi:hypothetical protein
MAPIHARGRIRIHDFAYPTKNEPIWKDSVERWYQLDAAAYGLCEVFTHSHVTDRRPPGLIVLASPGGSNHTDSLFIEGDAGSPAKFVHTLPNIRVSSLLQVMGWAGPALCLQNDPFSVSTAIAQATILLDNKFCCIWIFGCQALWSSKNGYQAFQIELSSGGNSDDDFEIGRGGRVNADKMGSRTDEELIEWLKVNSQTIFPLPLGLEMRRIASRG